jgi:hypothetical protein
MLQDTSSLSTFSPSHNSVADEDPAELVLPGCELVHTLNVTSQPDLQAVNQVLSCIEAEQDAVATWRVTRQGDVFDQKISLQGISQKRARSLRERLSKLDAVLRTSLEHQFRRVAV